VLPFIFDRFRQGDSSTTRAYGGLGLGLAIVRHLIDVHGGTVAAESDGEDRGATFRVRLPVRAPREPGEEPPASVRPPPLIRPAGESTVAREGVTVLVVDDQPDAREIVATVLARCGAHVDAAGSAVEALAHYDRAAPDVLVSDIAMPVADGYDLVRAVRERD